eukprot:scaffold1981_cov345-Pinguiococcus_pyrenoidosus.AAC.13
MPAAQKKVSFYRNCADRLGPLSEQDRGGQDRRRWLSKPCWQFRPNHVIGNLNRPMGGQGMAFSRSRAVWGRNYWDRLVGINDAASSGRMRKSEKTSGEDSSEFPEVGEQYSK